MNDDVFVIRGFRRFEEAEAYAAAANKDNKDANNYHPDFGKWTYEAVMHGDEPVVIEKRKAI